MLATHDLAFERNNSPLLSNIKFTLEKGKILQICGANGSGKSTLLRILAGYIEPSDGNVEWNQKSIYEQRDSYQLQIHYLGHENGIKPYLTVYENVKLLCALFNVHKAPIESIINKIGLTTKIHTQSRHLSAGQLRRLALSRLLVKPTQLWILDEPSTSLDQSGQQLLLLLISEHLSNEGSIILSTHQLLSFSNSAGTLWLGEKNA